MSRHGTSLDLLVPPSGRPRLVGWTETERPQGALAVTSQTGDCSAMVLWNGTRDWLVDGVSALFELGFPAGPILLLDARGLLLTEVSLLSVDLADGMPALDPVLQRRLATVLAGSHPELARGLAPRLRDAGRPARGITPRPVRRALPDFGFWPRRHLLARLTADLDALALTRRATPADDGGIGTALARLDAFTEAVETGDGRAGAVLAGQVRWLCERARRRHAGKPCPPPGDPARAAWHLVNGKGPGAGMMEEILRADGLLDELEARFADDGARDAARAALFAGLQETDRAETLSELALEPALLCGRTPLTVTMLIDGLAPPGPDLLLLPDDRFGNGRLVRSLLEDWATSAPITARRCLWRTAALADLLATMAAQGSRDPAMGEATGVITRGRAALAAAVGVEPAGWRNRSAVRQPTKPA